MTFRSASQNLSWFAARKQWKKFKNGKTYYLGRSGVNKTDAVAYVEAMDEWAEIVARLSAPEFRLEKMRSDLIDAGWNSEEIAAPEMDSSRLEFSHALHVVAPLIHGPRKSDHGKAVGDAIDRFMKAYQHQIKSGKRSLSRGDTLRIHLEHLRGFAGTRLVESLDSTFISDYYANLTLLIESNKIKPATALARFVGMKQLVRFLWEEGLIELPRNITSKMFSFAIPEGKREVFSVKDIQTLISLSNDRTRLYILLGLNCGFTQIDIAELAPGEYDSKTGTIIRKRSKTAHHAAVPEVTRRLWPETKLLLNKHLSHGKSHLLSNKKGGPLLVSKINKLGKLSRNDAVCNAMNRLCKKVKTADRLTPELKDGTFTTFRNTAATIINQHATHRQMRHDFLGHAAATVADRSYAGAPAELLSDATDWLRDQLGISTAMRVPPANKKSKPKHQVKNP